jgi:hypothetical protein
MDHVEDHKTRHSDQQYIPDMIDGRAHRTEVAEAQRLLEGFLVILQQVGNQGRAYMLSMDLYMAFERFAGIDLPSGFNRELGRRVNKACSDGRLPFQRTIKGQARLAAYQGIGAVALGMLIP